jgi:hypothetical protein
MTYTVAAKRWNHGWELHIPDVGVTQSATLASAKRFAQDYLAIILGGEPGDYDVVIQPEVAPELVAELTEARAKQERAVELQRSAAETSRRVARCLHDQHSLSGADVAVVLGVSAQRASQLLSGDR